jgi:hypothetical protein
MSKRNPQEVTLAVAKNFAGIITRWLTEDELRLANRLNATPAYSDGCCATHDFCDANMAMAEAMGMEGLDPLEYCDDGASRLRNLWEDAWNLAKAAEFDASKIKQGD